MFPQRNHSVRLSDLAIYRGICTVSNKHISSQFGETAIVDVWRFSEKLCENLFNPRLSAASAATAEKAHSLTFQIKQLLLL